MLNGFPTPPTDNLYKFLGIAGVVFVLAGNIFTSQTKTSTQELIAKEAERFIKQGTEDGWKMIDQVRLDYPDKAARETRLEKLQTELDQKRSVETKQLTDRLTEIKNESDDVITKLVTLERIGYLIAVFGFGMWAYKFQRHQDKIQWLERRTAELDFEKAHHGELTSGKAK